MGSSFFILFLLYILLFLQIFITGTVGAGDEPDSNNNNNPMKKCKHHHKQDSFNDTTMSTPCNLSTKETNILWTRPQIRRPLAGTTKRQIKLYRKTIREGLPVLTHKDIRRHRLPHHEVVCIELEEEGFTESAEHIRKLYNLNEEMREAAGPETIIWNRPQLKDQYLYLEKLRAGLTEAETSRKEGNVGVECMALLHLAIFFMVRADSCWWVAKHLFLLCVNLTRDYLADGGRCAAIVSYIYGLFLLEELHNPEEATAYLQTARKLSMGMPWTAEKELGHPQESIFVEACNLLYKALLQTAEDIRQSLPEQAIKLCHQAIRRALDAKHPELEGGALLLLGSCQIEAQAYDAAIETLKLYLEKTNESIDMNNLCRAHLELAICYKVTDNIELTLTHLENFKIVAETHILEEKLALANRFLGEYYLTMGDPETAVSFLISSFSTYFKLGMMEEMEQTRALTAIAMGHTKLPALDDHILMSGEKGNTRSLNKIVRWKNSHTPFWEESEESSVYSFDSLSQRSLSENASSMSQVNKSERSRLSAQVDTPLEQKSKSSLL